MMKNKSYIIFPNLLLLVILLAYLTNAYCLFKYYQVYIMNEIKNDNIEARCQSGDQDFGMLKMNYTSDIHWQFCGNPNVLYFCHFYWGSKQNIFDVYNGHFAFKCEPSHVCYWMIKEDGFTFPVRWRLMHSWK